MKTAACQYGIPSTAASDADRGRINMNDDYLTIGQMAELNHVSSQTLRLYDKKGLLSPAYQGESNGYRYYHVDQCERLDFIHTMKLCGMSLEQIRQHLNEASVDELCALLSEQERRLSREIDELTGNLCTIRRFTSNLNRMKALPPKGEVILEYMPSRRIDTFRTDIDFFEKGYSGYEIMLREFKSHMIRNDLPLSYFFNAGTLIEQKDFEEQNYCARTVFIFVDDNYPESSSQRIMPESMYMTVYADDTTQEHVHARRMFTEMERMGYCADGDYLCEVISHISSIRDHKRFITYKLQIPVRRK